MGWVENSGLLYGPPFTDNRTKITCCRDRAWGGRESTLHNIDSKLTYGQHAISTSVISHIPYPGGIFDFLAPARLPGPLRDLGRKLKEGTAGLD